MKILEELYYGNIADGVFKDSEKVKKLVKKEMALYEIVKDKLADEDKHLIDDYDEASVACESQRLAETYINGFKTGLLIGIEASDFDLN